MYFRRLLCIKIIPIVPFSSTQCLSRQHFSPCYTEKIIMSTLVPCNVPINMYKGDPDAHSVLAGSEHVLFFRRENMYMTKFSCCGFFPK